MRAERFGSYSIAATRPGTPGLLRLKSIIRRRRLCPPPRCRDVTLPRLLRPALLLSATVSDFSGVVFVISSKVEPDIPRRPGDVGLYCLIGILSSLYLSPRCPPVSFVLVHPLFPAGKYEVGRARKGG